MQYKIVSVYENNIIVVKSILFLDEGTESKIIRLLYYTFSSSNSATIPATVSILHEEF